MASRARFVANRSGIDKIARDMTAPLLRRLGEQVLAQVGTEHYELQTWRGATRHRVTVRTKDNWASRRHEARTHDLVRALGALHV